MRKESKVESFYNLLAKCEQAITGEFSKNIPLTIGLNVYLAQCSGDILDIKDLERLVAIAPSTFDRYLDILETQGVIETSSKEGSTNIELSLTANASKKFQALFGDETC